MRGGGSPRNDYVKMISFLEPLKGAKVWKDSLWESAVIPWRLRFGAATLAALRAVISPAFKKRAPAGAPPKKSKILKFLFFLVFGGFSQFGSYSQILLEKSVLKMGSKVKIVKCSIFFDRKFGKK